jgi:hypothetical protein
MAGRGDQSVRFTDLWWQDLDALGVDEVRARLAAGVFESHAVPLVQVWLQSREQDQRARESALREREAMDALGVARTATRLSLWAIGLAALSLVLSVFLTLRNLG